MDFVFEASVIAAAQNIFPGVLILGCYFHYAKAIWKHVQDLGLVVPFNNNNHVKELVKMIMSLGFLPLNLVRMNYQLLRNNPRTAALVAAFPPLHEFFIYFENT